MVLTAVYTFTPAECFSVKRVYVSRGSGEKSLDQRFVCWFHPGRRRLRVNDELKYSNCAVAPQQRHVNLELFVSVWNEHTEIFKHLRNAELARDSTLLLVVLHWWLVGIQDDLWVIVQLQWSLPGRPVSNQLCPQARPCGTAAVIKPNFSYLVQQCVLVVFTPELSEGGILCGNCISSVLLMSTDFSETHWFKCQYCVLWSPFLLGQAL